MKKAQVKNAVRQFAWQALLVIYIIVTAGSSLHDQVCETMCDMSGGSWVHCTEKLHSLLVA